MGQEARPALTLAPSLTFGSAGHAEALATGDATDNSANHPYSAAKTSAIKNEDTAYRGSGLRGLRRGTFVVLRAFFRCFH